MSVIGNVNHPYNFVAENHFSLVDKDAHPEYFSKSIFIHLDRKYAIQIRDYLIKAIDARHKDNSYIVLILHTGRTESPTVHLKTGGILFPEGETPPYK